MMLWPLYLLAGTLLFIKALLSAAFRFGSDSVLSAVSGTGLVVGASGLLAGGIVVRYDQDLRLIRRFSIVLVLAALLAVQLFVVSVPTVAVIVLALLVAPAAMLIWLTVSWTGRLATPLPVRPDG